jgi:adenosyl cobinamide kinase/adenosyl cobinamide phosphate guanylyltransferase
MVLVTGGIASGKRTFVRGLGYADVDMGTSLDADARVLVGLEELLRERELTPEEFGRACERDVVVCLEVGQGVVPVDLAERAWRERVGRCCQRLAAEASSVFRLVCGVAVCVKGA